MSAIYKKNLGEEERVEKCSNRSDTLAKVQRRSIPVEKIVIREVLSAEGVVRRGKESVAGLVSRFPCCSGKWGEQAERTRKEILQTVRGRDKDERDERDVSTRHFVGSFGRDGEGEEVQRAKKIRRFIPWNERERVLEGRGKIVVSRDVAGIVKDGEARVERVCDCKKRAQTSATMKINVPRRRARFVSIRRTLFSLILPLLHLSTPPFHRAFHRGEILISKRNESPILDAAPRIDRSKIFKFDESQRGRGKIEIPVFFHSRMNISSSCCDEKGEKKLTRAPSREALAKW